MKKTVLITLASVIGVVALAVGGWKLNWWMAKAANKNETQIYQQSLAAQTGDIQAARAGIAEFYQIQGQINSSLTPASEVSSLSAQLTAVTTQTCNIANNITVTFPSDIARFTAQQCN